MRSAITLSIAALAGSVLAAPSYGHQHKHNRNVHVIVETVVETVYVTDGQDYPQPTASASPIYEALPPATIPTPTPAPAPAPAPAPEPNNPPAYEAPSSPAPTPATGGYIDIVSKWRAKLGMAALEADSKLESNAMKVVVEGNGVMVHKLYPGTMAQVLAPGSHDMKSFLSVFVGGWLCEIPTLPGLNGICSTMSKGWDYQGQKGHAELLTSKSYTKIGCSHHAGIWCCDLA